MGTSGFTGGAGLSALAAHPWAYPALEVVHIVGIALLVGNLALLELRVWGVARELPLPALARASMALALAGFGLVLASGLTMFAANPAELLNAALFHARDGLGRLDGVARTQTALSLGLWLAVIICGRWIAYL
ncbi:MAG: hypothetical protein MUF08_19395 [Burkholderiaceae bacterium]|nr:hypothetical protein [Burkholderiaceae bacterium]